ncbi:hypothetical protein Ppa06_61490 [Planomonospora parontospora subsp. parontospora]|uniref:Uncharacterized protein n=2 Tax=Planomonospora parontospora TaxID=58119 RepID=A0AA37BF97_9ACTN|nr:hypothetical protein [Planomonospora parontospora]GGK62444.1 hypothetical protein GCM10010126_22290 [Planomonospora parontospora]GII12351.1 hypothetical protein Ppa06_61490 [Planomonospora parontospora subsp. parontospora]
MNELRNLFVSLGEVLSWLFSLAVLFLVIYGAIRLALKHDRRSRIPRPRDVADAELRERVAAERAAQKGEAEERVARRHEAAGSDGM